MADFTGWERDLVREMRVARLGTIGRDGQPHLVPVCFAPVDSDIAIAIDEKPKRDGTLARVRNIERDPRVTLLVDRYDDDWTQLAWVRVEGQATVMAEGRDWPGALQVLRERYDQYRAMALEGLPLIRIQPERVVSWRWNK